MGFTDLAVVAAAFLCSLVAGLLFAFSIVVMPGIKALSDRGFIASFQAMDRVIQNKHPIFMLVWVGSGVAVISAAALGYSQPDRVGRVLIVSAALIYTFGVQLPTIAINIPLNNGIQAIDVEAASEMELREARALFEPRWNRWNLFRTVVASTTALLLMVFLWTIESP